MKTFYFVITLLLHLTMSMAQLPPPMGPPIAGAASIPLRKIYFGDLNLLIKKGVEKSVQNCNEKIDSAAIHTGIKAKLSFKIKSTVPIYSASEGLTFPNSMYVQLRTTIEYSVTKISIAGKPYLPQKLSQELLVNISCDKWYSKEGKTSFRFFAQKILSNNVVFDNEILRIFLTRTLPDYILYNLAETLTNNNATAELPIESTPCNCLNFDKGTAPSYMDGYAGFYYLPVRKIAIGQLYSDPVIRLISIKRLPTPLFTASLPVTDGLQIEYMANFNSDVVKIQAPLENETIYFKDDYSLKFEHPSQYNRLVVIANITLPATQTPILSGFLHFEKDKKFGAGIQKLTVMREVPAPVSSGMDERFIKPQSTLVPIYELSFDIRYSKSKIN